MKTLTLIIALGFSFSCFAQKSKSPTQKLKYSSDLSLIKESESCQAFYISTKPITNREYMVYLLWLQEVYTDYPLVVSNAIPRQHNIVWYDSAYVESDSYLNNLLKGVNPEDKKYVFNSLYLDYPITGLSWQQAMDFSKWLSDRYNEYVLIKEKFYQLDLYQGNENSFNTESYLAGQYMGLISNPKKEVKWKDNLLIPAFRLPTTNELVQSKDLINVSSI